MMAEVARHVWESTAFGVVAALAAWGLRRNRASVRYCVWMAASLKFLAPFAVLVGLGGRAPVPSAMAPAVAQARAALAMRPAGRAESPAAPRPGSSAIPASLTGLWAVGFLAVVSNWAREWRRARSGPARSLGVFGIFQPALVMPAGIAGRLTPAQLEAVLAHERCHIRRRDNRFAAVHMAVEAIFWFDPMVWWIGARLVEERERACDDEVLRQGNAPETYAEGILRVCRFSVESRLDCAPGLTGADLKQRIETILAGRAAQGLTLGRKALLAGAGAAAVAGPVLVGVVAAPQIRAQLRFEVATIRPSKGAIGRGLLEVLPGGGLRMGGATMRQLIAMAYDIHDEQVAGGPRWVGSDMFDLLAKPERVSSAEDLGALYAPGTTGWDHLRERLRTLLAERRRLAVHTNGRQQPGYALVTAKGGSKLAQSANPGPPGTNRSYGRIDGRAGTMRMLATVLSNYLGRPVVDRTGLAGVYDYKLEYAQEEDDAKASIFSALPEQLGLKLEATRVAVETIVIDRVERPSEN